MAIESKLSLAMELAEEKHAEQRYGNASYVFHLIHTQQVVHRFGYNPFGEGSEDHIKLSEDLSVAALLHDIVEDTDVTLKQIRKIFGKRVASLVNGVTNEAGVNRRERHKKTYPKTRRIPGALILKLSDRIANIEACLASGDSRIYMYRKEWESFQEALRSEGEYDKMWSYIERLLRRTRD